MQPPPLILTRPNARPDPLAEAEGKLAWVQALDAEGRHEGAVELLRQAAEAGYPRAMTFLGARLLIGRAAPLAPAEAIPMLQRAAAAGQADANLIMATLAGAAASDDVGWASALDYLERAAELGSDKARGQLRLLSGHVGPLAGAQGVWGRLRRRIDLAGWLRPPPKRVLSDSPRLRAVEGFLSAATCDWIVSRAKPLLKPAGVYDPTTGGERRETARSNSALEFDAVNADLVLMLVRARISLVTRLPTVAMEPVQALHYAVGQSFEPHFDFLDPTVEAYARDAAERGQRIATFLVYLNADYEGGETRFPALGLAHRGAKGDALYFANVDGANQPDRRTLHAGAPPTAGEKWLLSQWVRDRAAPMAR